MATCRKRSLVMVIVATILLFIIMIVNDDILLYPLSIALDNYYYNDASYPLHGVFNNDNDTHLIQFKSQQTDQILNYTIAYHNGLPKIVWMMWLKGWNSKTPLLVRAVYYSWIHFNAKMDGA